VVLILLGCGGSKRSVSAPSKEEPAKKGEPASDGLSKAKPDFTLAATELAEEYRAGKSAANKKYKGKVLEVTGIIRDIGRDAGGEKRPYLELGTDANENASVFCYTADREPWQHHAPGQKVTLKGRWPDFLVVATLVESVVTESVGGKVSEITAEQLSDEFSSGDGEEKYDGKRLFVSGTIADKEERPQLDAIYVQLRADGNYFVYCLFNSLEKDVVKKLNAGEKIRVFARVQRRRRGIELNKCILMQ
jgi:hypothetical protein